MTTEDRLRDYLKRTVAQLHETQRRLDTLQQRQNGPVAIVAAACRLPGGTRTPDGLWQLVLEERDAVTGYPQDRGWDPAQDWGPGGFLDDVTEFDPAFFGMPAAEAALLDPQQRLLLETSWEALVTAGVDPPRLRRSRTGIFLGLMYNDHYFTWRDRVPPHHERLLSLGSSPSIAAGRLAYTYGLCGPAVTVDTACSSSLVALHLAAAALRRGECDLALVGGAAVMSSPLALRYSRQQGLLSPDGRSRSYAAGAAGWGLSEGVGLVVVERLGDAIRAEHPVLAVLRGSAVNQVGAGQGLTAPSAVSQQQVIDEALAAAGLDPTDVDAVEGHGTGTPLGDVLEVAALTAAYGRDRSSDRPLWLGSVKSNLGHTQAAGGIAGVVKAALAMRHGVLPRSLHSEVPAPEIDWSAGVVRLLTAATPWPRTDRPRRAGVSSFGISGTNAHVVLEEPPLDLAQRRSNLPAPVFHRRRYWLGDST